jgi:uncharacterized protein (TIGR03000 family)
MKLPFQISALVGVTLCFSFPISEALAQKGGHGGGHGGGGVHVGGASGGVRIGGGGVNMGRPSGGIGMGQVGRPGFPNHNGNGFGRNGFGGNGFGGAGVFFGIGGGYWGSAPYYYDGYYGGVGPYSDALSFYPPGDVFGSPLPGGGYPGGGFPGAGYPDTPPIPPVEVAPPNPRTTTALVIVLLPTETADLWFNGAKTQSRGQKREFVTPELPPGQVFTYEVKIRWTVDGKDYERTRTVSVQAGAQSVVNLAIEEREQLPAPVQVVPPIIKM